MKIVPIIHEKELLVKLQDGDQVAFETLYNTYAARLSAKLFMLLKSWDEVEEALQELFVKVWENRKKIDPDKSFQSYLYTIASNIANDYYRKVSKDQALAQKLLERISELHHPELLATQIQPLLQRPLGRATLVEHCLPP